MKEKTTNPIIGKCILRHNKGGEISYEGLVVDTMGDDFLVKLFTDNGTEPIRLLDKTDIMIAQLFDDPLAMSDYKDKLLEGKYEKQ